jgi:putative ABC transport system permease protein
MLRKARGAAVVVVITLGLGIGANTAIFSVAQGVLLRSLPYHEPQQLVDLAVHEDSLVFYGVSDPEFADLRTETNSFEQIEGYHGGEVTIGDSLSARRVPVMRVTAGLLPMLGVTPHMGRFFTPDEDTRDGIRAIVLSYGMWQREFGGDPDVLGRSIMLRDFDATFAAAFNQPVPIVGVMPTGFEIPDPHWEAWVPFGLDFEDPVARNNHYIDVLARLKPDVPLASAQSEVDVLAARSTEDYPDIYPADRGLTIRLQPYHTRIVGHVSAPIYLLLGAVGFVLLTACVNVVNLLLSQGQARRHEIAIRTALGASRGRVIRQLVTENLLLAALGGLAGLAVASWGVSALLAIAPSNLPRLDQVGINSSVLSFSILVTIGTGLMFGMLPAMQAAKTNVHEVLTAGGGVRGCSRSGQAMRRLLIVSQVAFAVVLVTGAGLMLRSIRNVYTANPGFRTHNVLTFRLDPAVDKYHTPESRITFYRDLLALLGRIPGVLSVGAAHSLPLGVGGTNLSIEIEGRPAASIADAPRARVQFVTPEYSEALGLTLIRGRFFTRDDDARSIPVVVVTEAMASAHWPGEDPIGKRMRMYGRRWMEVIGIVKDVYHYGVHRDPGTWWYVPHAQGYISSYTSPRTMHIAVLADSDPTTLVHPIRTAVARFDPNVPMSRVRTMDDGFDAAVDSERFVTVLLSVFGIVALCLAVVGVHGVISLTVAQRTREIGIRMALGAVPAEVLLQVMREGLLLSLTGVALGLLGSVVLSRGLETMVFGVTPTDPLTYGGVFLLLTTAAAVAAFVPARRAMRVDPVEALRQE